MIKFNFVLGWVILSILFAFPYRVSGQISKTVSFEKADIKRTTLKKSGKDYESIIFSESYPSRDVGKPDLPVFYYRFYIPKGQVVMDVKFKSVKQDEIQLTSDLVPVQHPVITNFGSSDTVFDVPDTKVYNTDSFYPDKQAKVLSTDFIDGNLQIVTIEVYPMQYQPKQKKLRLSSDIEISLVTSSNPDSKSTLTLVVPKFHDTESIYLLKSLVQNPGDVPSADEPVAQRASNLKSAAITSWSIPFYEYVIITSRALKPAFSEFLIWKKRKGYNAGIVCIEDILADPAATGDAISNLNDDAGKLRQYLRAGYTNTNPKTIYALFGGDYSLVPIRYGCGSEDTWDKDGMINEEKVPTDLYFSALNGSWNADGDIYTGECQGDQAWFSPNIYVGRLLCTSETDVKNWTQKLLKYEQNPGNGNYSYLTKSLFTEADGIGTTDPMHLPSIFETKNIIMESPSDDDLLPYYPKGADVISLLNSGYGLYSNFNHGSPLGFGTATHGENVYGHDVHYGVTAVDDYDNHDEYNHMYSIKPEPNNGFDNLTNTNNPFVIYSISCTNIPFDDYDTYSGCRNLGESFTCMRLTGGPAYLGNTREGSTGQASDLWTFFTQMQSTNHIGMAEAATKIGKGPQVYYKYALAHNIIGCPEMPMWTATPTLFNASVTENGTSVTVNTGGVIADKICVMSALNNGYFEVQPSLSSYTFTNVSKPYYVTITKSNYIPFRNSLTNVYIQNKNLSSTAYLNCQTVSAGYDVDANQTVGNVVIQSGANITFDATGDIILAGGFEVQVGATFEAK